MTTVIIYVVLFVVGFVVGYLVRRNNPKVNL
jgi:hypothetical protein